jgi:hypothetical protein
VAPKPQRQRPGEMKDAEYFARVMGDNMFRKWLEKERAESIKYLTNAADLAMIHRAQGRVQLLDDLLTRVDAGKNLR